MIMTNTTNTLTKTFTISALSLERSLENEATCKKYGLDFAMYVKVIDSGTHVYNVTPCSVLHMQDTVAVSESVNVEPGDVLTLELSPSLKKAKAFIKEMAKTNRKVSFTTQPDTPEEVTVFLESNTSALNMVTKSPKNLATLLEKAEDMPNTYHTTPTGISYLNFARWPSFVLKEEKVEMYTNDNVIRVYGADYVYMVTCCRLPQDFVPKHTAKKEGEGEEEGAYKLAGVEEG